jgi:integrase
MTPAEISQLLQACASHRRLLLETAFLSGLRAKELRNLTLDHLDLDRCGLRLDAIWTKNRQPGFQPLPTSLVHRLHDFCISGEPARLYARFYGRKDANRDVPANPLLYVPTHTARDLDMDLQAAGIQKYTLGGKLDFHGCGVAYITFCDRKWSERQRGPSPCSSCHARTDDERLWPGA